MLTARAPMVPASVEEGVASHPTPQRTISDVQLIRAIDQVARILCPSDVLRHGGEGVEAVIRDLKDYVRTDKETFKGLINEHGGELHIYLRAVQGQLACDVSTSQREPEPETPWRGRPTEVAQKLALIQTSLERIGGINKVFREFEALRHECNPSRLPRALSPGEGQPALIDSSNAWSTELALPPLK